MSKGARGGPRRGPPPGPPPASISVPRPGRRWIVLDTVTVADIRKWRKRGADVLGYHWDHYANLLHQRTRRGEWIRSALQSATTGPFEFDGWQRVVDYEFSFEPLSAAGSVLTAPGGRFNIGAIDPGKFPPFPALYLAKDRETALFEKYSTPPASDSRLDSLDFALRNTGSITVVGVKGRLENVIDVRDTARLEPFVDVIRALNVPRAFSERAKSLGIGAPEIIRTTQKLTWALMHPEWRVWSEQVDVPAPSQAFGQMALAAGVEGIIYESVRSPEGAGVPCLAVLLPNLSSSSYVELVGGAPADVATTLNTTNWKDFV